METAEVTLILCVLLLIFVFYLWWQDQNHSGQMPCPKGLPVIGHLLHLDPTSPHITFTKWSRELGSIFQVQIVKTKMVILNSYDAIHEATITRKDIVAGRPDQQYRTSLVSRSRGIIHGNPNPKWKMIRNKCHRHLKLQGENRTKIEEVLQSSLTDLVHKFKKTEGKPFDPKEALQHLAISITCTVLVGRKYELTDDLIKKIIQFKNLFLKTLTAGADGMLLDTFPWLRYFGNSIYKKIMELHALQDYIWSIMKNDAEKNLKHVGENDIEAGVMAMILKLQKKDLCDMNIDDLDVEIVFQNILVGAFETTHSTFYALLNILSQNPRVLTNLQMEVDKVVGKTSITFNHRPEMPYTQATIYEILRYTSVVPLAVPHTTQENTTLQGYAIPAGTTVLLNLWAMHHDESFWPDPFEFRPERFLDAEGQLLGASSDVRKHLMPFGAGTRACMGEVFAQARLFLLTSSIVQHFHIQPGGKMSSHDPRSYEFGLALQPPEYEIIAIPRA